MPAPRVLFLLPGPYVYEDRCQAYIGQGSFFGYREPVEEMAAAQRLMESGASCSICYAKAEGLCQHKILSRIFSFAPDLVVISTTFPGHVSDLAWAAEIKKAAPLCMVAARGGQMPFVDRQRIFGRFAALDAIVFADYGQSLVSWLKGNFSGPCDGIELRGMPGPGQANFSGPLCDLSRARSIVKHSAFKSPDTGEPMATILTGIGCGHRCSFCLAPLVSGKAPRFREPEDVVDEMAKAKRDLNIRRFFLRADDLCQDRDFILSLSQTLARRALKIRFVATARADQVDDEIASALCRAGCWGLSMGLESGSPETLSRIKKGLAPDRAKAALLACRKARILSMGYFMLGFSWERENDVKETIAAAKRLLPDVCEFFFPYPFPGTRLFDQALQEGLINVDAPPEKSQVAPVFVPAKMTAKELVRLRNLARLNPVALFRAACAILRQAKTPQDALRIVTSRLAALPRALFPVR